MLAILSDYTLVGFTTEYTETAKNDNWQCSNDM